jgi:hypothetical protein
VSGLCSGDGATACSDDEGCRERVAGPFGACADLGVCEMDQTLSCRTVGALCNQNNPCILAPSGFCVNETICEVLAYQTPAVEFGALPDAAGALVASIEAQMPAGDTPSGPALQGAINHARTYASANPGHSVVAVLATDGLPSECLGGAVVRGTTAAALDEVVAVAANGLSGQPSVPTFVIGVFSAADVEAPANLNRIATAGGTNQAFIIDAGGNVADQFLAALNQIRAAKLACEFQLPPAPSGQSLAYDQVNVVLTDSAGTPRTLYYVPSPAGCLDTGDDWHYDVAPETGTPTKIVACPATCGVLGAATGGSVQIQLGCRQVIR